MFPPGIYDVPPNVDPGNGIPAGGALDDETTAFAPFSLQANSASCLIVQPICNFALGIGAGRHECLH